MTKVSDVPFVLGMVGGLLLFGAWLPFAIRESRRPVRWRDAKVPRAIFDAASPRDLAPRLTVVPVRVVAPAPRVSHRRIVIVVAVFTVWALATTRTTHRRV